MEAAWWLALTVTAIWQLRQGVQRLRTASQRINDDIAALNRDHPRTVSLNIQ